MYEMVFFSKFISHENEINVNNETQLESELYLPTRSLQM